MKFKKIKNNELLIFELNHFLVRMAILRRKGKKTDVIAQVEQACLSPLEGAAFCLEELKKKKRLPKKVIMVSTEAIPALLNLKFHPGQTITEQEEVIRWEMEENLSVFTKAPSTETLLNYPGFLQQEQFDKLAEYEKEHSPTTESNLTKRLKSASILDTVDFEEILDFTDQWPHAEEASMCSWNNKFSEKTKNDSCLSGFIGIPRRDIWLDFFYQNGLSLCGTLPWALTALTMLEYEDIKEENLLYVEEHPGYWVSARMRKGMLIGMQCYEVPSCDTVPEAILMEITESESSALSLNSVNYKFEDFLQELPPATKLNRLVNVPMTSEKIIVQAAARQAWQLPSNLKHIMLPTALPPVPVRKRPSFWWVLVILSAGLFYTTLVFSWINEINKLKTKFESVDKEIKSTATNLNKDKEDKQKISTFNKKIDTSQTLIKKLKNQLDHAKLLSSDFIVRFVSTLNTANIPNLRLQEIICQRQGSFEISGECLSETEAYELSSLLASNLKLSKLPTLILNNTDERFSFSITIPTIKGGK